jgi:hypothetical protein
MTGAIGQFRDAIERAKQGDPEATLRIRNVLRTVADGAKRDDLIRLAEALVTIRDDQARRAMAEN